MSRPEDPPEIRPLPEILQNAGDEMEETANALENLGLTKLAEDAHNEATFLAERAHQWEDSDED